jgi:CHAT domain-containing protein
MDEQRMQTYVGLIQQLLGCSQGEEGMLLQANAALVDAGLVAVMGQYADWMDSQGNSNSRRLRQLAGQLAQALGLPERRSSTSRLDEHEGEVIFPKKSRQKPNGFGKKIETKNKKKKYQQNRPGYGKSLMVPSGHPESVSGYIDGIGEIDDIEMDIMAYTAVLQQSRIKAQQVDLKCELAYAYHNRTQGVRPNNIKHSIDLYKEVLPEIEKEIGRTKLWVKTQNDLGTAYLDLLDNNCSENIENAIDCFRLSLNRARELADSRDDETRAMLNLAVALRRRRIGDRIDNCNQAICELTALLKGLNPRVDRYLWIVGHLNLANAYMSQIEDGAQEEGDFKRAQDSLESAQEVVTTGDESLWVSTYAGLGNFYVLKNRYFAGSETPAEKSKRAIKAYELALEKSLLDSIAPENRAQMYSNLATCYRISYENGGQHSDLDSAVLYGEMGLVTHSLQHKGIALASLGGIHWRRSEIDVAVSEEQRRLAVDYYDEALRILTPDIFSYECRSASITLGSIHSECNEWRLASEAYKLSLEAAENLYQSCLFIKNRFSELRKFAHLPHCAAYAYAKFGLLQKDEEWLKRAIVTLDDNRGRNLREVLDRDRAELTQLQKLAPALHEKYQKILGQSRHFESQQRYSMVAFDRHSLTHEDLRNTARELRSGRKAIIAQIRQVPGYEDFLTPAKWEDIQNAVTTDRPLLYLVTTPNGGMVLIVTVDAIDVLWLDDLKQSTLREILYGPADEKELTRYLGTYQNFRNDSKTNYPAWCQEIDTTTRQLWDSLMGQIVQHLKSKGFDRATLIPTGFLSLLPLHAAWTEDTTRPTGRRYALDDIHFTYTPNAKSLTAARAIADRVEANAILAIDEPKHRYLDPNTSEFKPVESLPSSSQEVASAIATFPSRKKLPHAEATRQAVLDALPNINVLHCSCHGNVNFQEPLKSGLAMAGDGEAAVLTLRDFLDLKLTDGDRGGLRLAILSACETGLPGLDNIDEVVSLPIGLLQAGVAGVIASLWIVSEDSTMLLLTKFYELWRKEKHLPADQALRQAQIWLRDLTEGESAPLLSPDHRTYTPNNRPFASPYYWSAFSYNGL